MIDSTTTASELLDFAIAKLKDVPSDDEFIVRDLFCGVDWKRIPLSTRSALGTMFRNYVLNPENGISVKMLDKTTQKQQQYKKL